MQWRWFQSSLRITRSRRTSRRWAFFHLDKGRDQHHLIPWSSWHREIYWWLPGQLEHLHRSLAMQPWSNSLIISVSVRYIEETRMFNGTLNPIFCCPNRWYHEVHQDDEHHSSRVRNKLYKHQISKLFSWLELQIKVGGLWTSHKKWSLLKKYKEVVWNSELHCSWNHREEVVWLLSWYLVYWSINVTFWLWSFTLLYGVPPFETKSTRETYDKIRKCIYKFEGAHRNI
jgi:hypothetical protein